MKEYSIEVPGLKEEITFHLKKKDEGEAELELYPQTLLTYYEGTERRHGVVEVEWTDPAKEQIAQMKQGEVIWWDHPIRWYGGKDYHGRGEGTPVTPVFATSLRLNSDDDLQFQVVVFDNVSPVSVVSQKLHRRAYLPNAPASDETFRETAEGIFTRRVQPDTADLTEFHRLIKDTYSNGKFRKMTRWAKGYHTPHLMFNFLMDYLGGYQTKEAVVLGIGQIEEELTRLKEALD